MRYIVWTNFFCEDDGDEDLRVVIRDSFPLAVKEFDRIGPLDESNRAYVRHYLEHGMLPGERMVFITEKGTASVQSTTEG